MGNCLPLIGGHSNSSPTTSNASQHQTPISYTNPLALPHNSSYVNNLYERNQHSESEGDCMRAEHSKRVQSLLAQIPAMGYRKEMGEAECAICMGELDVGERVRYLPCMHLFHVDCVDDWLVRSLNCPSCLEPVDSTMLSSFTAHNTLKLDEIASSSASN